MKPFCSLTLMLLFCAAITSCQKEIILDNPATDTTGGGGGNIPPSTNGELLVRVYGRAPTGADSNVSNYTYNSMKKLISRHIIIYAFGASNNTQAWYERNAAGLIVKSRIYQVTSTNPFPTDTSVTFHNYTAGANPMLQSSVSLIDFSGVTISDSVVYTYNSLGRVIKAENFQSGFLSTTPELTGRNVFTYDANGNPIKVESYSISSGVASLDITQTYTYDNKPDPLNYSVAEAFVISDLPPLKNNVLTFTLLNTSVGATSATSNNIYTYNSAGKPATFGTTAVYTGPLAQKTVTNFTVYYQ